MKNLLEGLATVFAVESNIAKVGVRMEDQKVVIFGTTTYEHVSTPTKGLKVGMKVGVTTTDSTCSLVISAESTSTELTGRITPRTFTLHLTHLGSQKLLSGLLLDISIFISESFLILETLASTKGYFANNDGEHIPYNKMEKMLFEALALIHQPVTCILSMVVDKSLSTASVHVRDMVTKRNRLVMTHHNDDGSISCVELGLTDNFNEQSNYSSLADLLSAISMRKPLSTIL